jgi:hypothetical protein
MGRSKYVKEELCSFLWMDNDLKIQTLTMDAVFKLQNSLTSRADTSFYK